MALEVKGVCFWSDAKEVKDAITALVDAVVGQNVPRERSDQVYAAGWNLAEVYQSRQAVYKDDHWLVDKKSDDAITALVIAAVGQDVPRGPYGDQVYEAALNIAEAYQNVSASYTYRLTDIAEYEAELERRRQIGLTIDPATAETAFWYANANDPYNILDERYHGNVMVYEYFVRNPGASQRDWVHLYDLPRATRTAFKARDKRLIDLAEHETEFERRRRIGVAIDPATAETASWWVDDGDPYGMLDSEFHEDGASRQYFVRNPGGEWVIYTDLPEETRNLLFFKAVRNERMAADK